MIFEELKCKNDKQTVHDATLLVQYGAKQNYDVTLLVEYSSSHSKGDELGEHRSLSAPTKSLRFP